MIKCRLRADGPIEQYEESRAIVTPESVAREAADFENEATSTITSAVFPDLTRFNKDTGTIGEFEPLVGQYKATTELAVEDAKKRVKDIQDLGKLGCEVLEKRIFAATSPDKIIACIAPKIREHMQTFPLLTPAGKVVTFKIDESNQSVTTTDLPAELTGVEIYINRRLKRHTNYMNRGFQNKRPRNNYY